METEEEEGDSEGREGGEDEKETGEEDEEDDIMLIEEEPQQEKEEREGGSDDIHHIYDNAHSRHNYPSTSEGMFNGVFWIFKNKFIRNCSKKIAAHQFSNNEEVDAY
jgi:hypothetical protein